MALHLLSRLLRKKRIAWGVVGLLALGAAGLLLNRIDHLPAANNPQPAPALKILTNEEGIYRITSRDLAAAGFSVADPSRLRLSRRGEPRPLWLETSAEGYNLFFHAQPSDSRYTSQAVYWLAATSAPQPAPADLETLLPDNPQPVASAATQTRFEFNQHYYPQAAGHDPWFWLSLLAPASTEIELHLGQVDTTSHHTGWIAVHGWGASQAPVSPDHALQVVVNGQLVAEEAWDGKGPFTVQAELPPGVLVSGENKVRLTLPGTTGAPADLLLVDWIEVGCERRLATGKGQLAFTSRGEVHLLPGFSGKAHVYDITDPAHPFRLAGLSVTQEGVIFQGQEGRRYLAIDDGGYLQPLALEPVIAAPDLHTFVGGADYLVIGPQSLLDAVQPLLEWRQAGGLVVQTAPLEAVFDQFGYGLPEPQAVQRFIQFAAGHWQPAPRYVLLIGDASYDPRGYLTPPAPASLPAFLLPTIYGGETASDLPFAELDEDGLPDLAVGRIPAQTPAQVQLVVQKILAYENRSGQPERRILAVADGQEHVFQTDAAYFLSLFPPPHEARLFVPSPGSPDAGSETRAFLEQGAQLAAYFGHGSLQMWGKDRLLTVEEAGLLANQSLPVMLHMTCLTGYFVHPEVVSLAETLLWNEGGAAAVIAPTSLTLLADQSAFFRPFAAAWARAGSRRLGDLFLSTQRQAPLESPGARDVLNTFLLFGDPALQLPGAGAD